MGSVTNDASLHLLADAYSLDLTAGTATLLRDGQETSELTATLVDKHGDPVVDQRIDFSLTGNGTLSKAFQNTDADGEAVITLRSDIGTANANARVFGSVSTVIDSIDVPLYGVTLSIKATPTTLVADGDQQSTIEVTVKEKGSSTPLVKRLVSFAFGPGNFSTITAKAETDNRGIATAYLTADSQVDTSGTVTGRLGADPATTLTASTNVNIVAPVRYVEIDTPTENWVLRNNSDTISLRAFVTDNDLVAVAGEKVTWSLGGTTPAGVSVAPLVSTTDASGYAPATLKGDANAADATARVKAAVGSALDSLDVSLLGVAVAVSAAPTTITSNGVAQSVITARLTNTAGQGISGETITFTTDLGTINATRTTDDDGMATAKLTAGTTAGTATVTAYSGSVATGVSGTATVTFQLPTVASLALASVPSNLQVKGTGGIETSSVTATVRDMNNQPVPTGVAIRFTMSPAGAGKFFGTAVDTTVVTSPEGTAVVEFQSGTVATDVTITAQTISSTIVSARSVITVGAGPTASLSIAASAIAWEESLYGRDLSALLADKYGNALPNTQVVWTLSDSTIAAIPVYSETNEQGLAKIKMLYVRGKEAEELTIYCTNQEVTDSLTLPQGNIVLSIESGSTTLLRDGSDSLELKAEVLDAFGTKVGLLGLSWSVTGSGSLTTSVTATNKEGEAVGNNFYIADAATADVLDTVQVAFGGITASRALSIEGITVEILSVEPDTLSANGRATAAVTARLKKTTDLSVLSGYPLTFTTDLTDLGTIEASGVTGSDGTAAVTFTAGTTTGTATITAARSTVTDTAPLELITSNSTAIAITSDVDALDVKGTGGDEVATITVTVWDAAGQPVPNGTLVVLTASSGTFSTGESSRQKLTGSNGTVAFTYQSGTTSGTVTFTATSGTATGSAALITVASGPANSILLGYDTAATTPVNGISTVTISALVADTYGNAVATDSQVFFEIIAGGTGNAVITPVATTDETGLAEATLSYPDTEILNTINVQVTCDGVVQTIMVTLP